MLYKSKFKEAENMEDFINSMKVNKKYVISKDPYKAIEIKYDKNDDSYTWAIYHTKEGIGRGGRTDPLNGKYIKLWKSEKSAKMDLVKKI